MITLDIYFNKLVGNGITLIPKQPFSNSRMLVANFAHLTQAMNGRARCLLPLCALMCAKI